jgi:hypothetical protein
MALLHVKFIKISPYFQKQNDKQLHAVVHTSQSVQYVITVNVLSGAAIFSQSSQSAVITMHTREVTRIQHHFLSE